jgi:general stress protein YciG
MPFTRENASDLGRRGGQSTVARHGPLHMQVIGTAGQAAFFERFLGGDADLAQQYFSRLGRIGAKRRSPEDAND